MMMHGEVSGWGYSQPRSVMPSHARNSMSRRGRPMIEVGRGMYVKSVDGEEPEKICQFVRYR